MIYSFLVAVAFLTVFPVLRDLPTSADVARSRVWYPLVGLLLGVLLATVFGVVGVLWPPGVAAVVLLAVWLAVTGALHLDGLADLCDGLFGGTSPVDRLRIMKDPRHGTFGVTAAMLVLLGKHAALASLLQANNPNRALWAVAAAVAWSRALVLLMAANAPYPRSEGTGKASVRATRWTEAIPLTGGTGGLLLLLALTSDFALCGLALLSAFWAVVGLRRVCEKLLGGVTGDCLGASIEVGEVVVLVVAALGKMAAR